MGFLIVWFSILFAGLMILLLGPLLHYWVVKKLVVFTNPTLKKCLLFFVSWLVISLMYGWLSGLVVEGAASNIQDAMTINKMVSNIGLLVTLITQTLMGRSIFKESYSRSFMASVVYIIVLALLSAVLLAIGIFSGVELFSAFYK